MELDLADVLKLPANDQPSEMERLIAIISGMQEGYNMMVGLLADHAARIKVLTAEVRQLRTFQAAATPRKSPLIVPGLH